MESTSKQRQGIQTGICKNWFEQIGKCRGGNQSIKCSISEYEDLSHVNNLYEMISVKLSL